MSLPWTPADDAALRLALTECTSGAELSARVGRSFDACTHRALLIGIGRLGAYLERNRRERAQRRDTPVAPRPAMPRGASVEGLDYEDDAATVPTDRGPGLGPVPAVAASARVELDPVERVERRDEATRLRRENEDLVRRLKEANARQRFIDAAASYREPPRIYAREHNPNVREMTPIVLASDWHVEEPVEPEAVAFRNEFNLDIADARIERFFRSIIWNVEHHRASGRIAIRDLVLWLGGDLYSGYIHPELMEVNALSPVEVVRWLLPRLRNGIATLLESLGLEHLEIPCSYGNHGRSTDKPRVATGYANSFDWLLYHALADEFRSEPRVHFEITASAHQYVEVYGQTIHFHHGDDIKYQGGVGGLGIPLLKAVPLWERVKPAAVHCIGHWHQLRDYGRAVVNGSLIGFGPYSQRIRVEFEAPQQAMFYIDKVRGKSMLTALWVSEREREAA